MEEEILEGEGGIISFPRWWTHRFTLNINGAGIIETVKEYAVQRKSEKRSTCILSSFFHSLPLLNEYRVFFRKCATNVHLRNVRVCFWMCIRHTSVFLCVLFLFLSSFSLKRLRYPHNQKETQKQWQKEKGNGEQKRECGMALTFFFSSLVSSSSLIFFLHSSNINSNNCIFPCCCLRRGKRLQKCALHYSHSPSFGDAGGMFSACVCVCEGERERVPCHSPMEEKEWLPFSLKGVKIFVPWGKKGFPPIQRSFVNKTSGSSYHTEVISSFLFHRLGIKLIIQSAEYSPFLLLVVVVEEEAYDYTPLEVFYCFIVNPSLLQQILGYFLRKHSSRRHLKFPLVKMVSVASLRLRYSMRKVRPSVHWTSGRFMQSQLFSNVLNCTSRGKTIFLLQCQFCRQGRFHTLAIWRNYSNEIQ